MDRYARQRCLAHVGDAGQQRIERATYALESADSASGRIEREYLIRAGARHFDGGATSLPDVGFRHASVFRHEAAKHFAEGAWRALRQLQLALEQPT